MHSCRALTCSNAAVVRVYTLHKRCRPHKSTREPSDAYVQAHTVHDCPPNWSILNNLARDHFSESPSPQRTCEDYTHAQGSPYKYQKAMNGSFRRSDVLRRPKLCLPSGCRTRLCTDACALIFNMLLLSRRFLVKDVSIFLRMQVVGWIAAALGRNLEVFLPSQTLPHRIQLSAMACKQARA